MRYIAAISIIALLLCGCETTKRVVHDNALRPQVILSLPSYQEEVYWVPESHKEALVNPKQNEDGSYDKAYIKKIRFKDGHWGTLEELVQRLQEEYGQVLDIKLKPGVVVRKGDGKIVKKDEILQEKKKDVSQVDSDKDESNGLWDKDEKKAIEKGVLEHGEWPFDK